MKNRTKKYKTRMYHGGKVRRPRQWYKAYMQLYRGYFLNDSDRNFFIGYYYDEVHEYLQNERDEMQEHYRCYVKTKKIR